MAIGVNTIVAVLFVTNDQPVRAREPVADGGNPVWVAGRGSRAGELVSAANARSEGNPRTGALIGGSAAARIRGRPWTMDYGTISRPA